MKSYLMAGAYSLLDISKYLLAMILIFDINLRKKKLTIPIWFTTSILVCLIYFHFHYFHDLFFILPNLCCFMLVFFVEKKQWYKGIIYVLLSWVIMDASVELIKLLLTAVSNNGDYLIGFTTVNTLLDKILVLFVPFIYHLVVNVLIRKKVNYFLYPFQWIIILICFMGSLLIVIPLEGVINGNTIGSNHYIVMCICMMSILFLFIAVMVWQSYVMRKNVAMKREELRYQYMIKTQSDYFDGLMKNDEELRKFRHDMRAHITALSEYAKENKDDKMMEYLSNMEEKTNSIKAKRYTGNRAVDAVINDQIHQMVEKGISFDFDGICRTREEISDFDLCTVFYNLLKNAVEACEKVDSSKKSITVKVKTIGDKLGISIGNDTILKEIPKDGILETTKSDTVNHGLGTRSVRDVVTRYEGVYVNSIVDGRFVADVII